MAASAVSSFQLPSRTNRLASGNLLRSAIYREIIKAFIQEDWLHTKLGGEKGNQLKAKASYISYQTFQGYHKQSCVFVLQGFPLSEIPSPATYTSYKFHSIAFCLTFWVIAHDL